MTNNFKIRDQSKWAKPIMVFHYCNDEIVGFYGKHVAFSKNELKNYKKKYTCIFMTSKDLLSNIEDVYKMYMTSAKALKEATNGGVDLCKTGAFPKTAIALWVKLGFNKDIKIEPERLSKEEEYLIITCTTGPIIFGLKYEGIGYQYDFKSFYLSLLSSLNFLVPIKQGKAHSIKKLDEMKPYSKYMYGYYRCKIEISDDENIDRLFRFNKANIYTHFDLESANLLKLKVELIVDDKPNCYIYTRKDCVTGYQLFYRFKQCVWKLKEQKVEGAKLLSTSLWGGLCCASHKSVTIDKYEVQPKGDITKVQINEDETITYSVRRKKIFQYDWVRLKCFLLSKARLSCVEKMLPYNDVIVRSHTDSFTTTKQIDIETGTQLGDVAFEGKFLYELSNTKLTRTKL